MKILNNQKNADNSAQAEASGDADNKEGESASESDTVNKEQKKEQQTASVREVGEQV